MSLVFLDTETTGLDPKKERLIEIACYQTNESGGATNQHLHHYMNPEQTISYGAEKVHGLNNAMLKDKPLFSTIAQELIDFISGKTVVAHNAPFDVGFINAELKRCKHKVKDITRICTIIDSLSVAKKKHPKARNSLDALCKRYQVNNSERTLHGAMLDAKLLAQVYSLMMREQTTLAPTTNNSYDAKKEETHAKTTLLSEPLTIIKAKDTECKQHHALLKHLDNSLPPLAWQNE
jgi:DNA polymerase III subunit epsilon